MAISGGNSFKTRDTLNVGAQAFEIHRLEHLEKQGIAKLATLPFSLRVLLENLLRFEDSRFVHPEDIKALGSWTPGAAQKEIAFMPARVLLARFHRRPRRRRSRRHARSDEKNGRRSQAHQSALPRRTRHRPLRAGRQFRHRERLRPQRRTRIPAQRRALRVPPLGPESVSKFQSRPARHRHLPPGQSRISRARRLRDAQRQ